MKNIKLFKNFLNEELNYDTSYSAAIKLRNKGHVKRSNSILDKINIYNNINENMYKLKLTKNLYNVICESCYNLDKDILNMLLCYDDGKFEYDYLPVSFSGVGTNDSYCNIQDMGKDCNYISLHFYFSIGDGVNIPDKCYSFATFGIYINIIWNDDDTFEIDFNSISLENEWIFDTMNLFYDRRSALKFKKDVLKNIKKYVKEEKSSYEDLRNTFGDYSKLSNLDILYDEIYNKFSINDLYKE